MSQPSVPTGLAPAAGGAALTRDEIGRYARHIVLPEIGMEGQRRLKAARVLMVGAGGLGSPAGLYLAAAGVGALGVVDFDAVDASNLHRQVLYSTEDVGRPKLEAALERLHGVNPHVALEPHATRLTSDNALDIIAGYDLVVDGSDNFPTRYLVNDACVLLGKPYVYGAIFRFEGQVSIFAAPGGPCYRCLFREPPPPGAVPGCAEGGVLGVLPGIVGSMQALEAVKWITGAGETLAGRVLLFDALAPRWRELRLRRNAECPACGDRPTIDHLIDYEEFCGVKPDSAAGAEIPEISVVELKERLDRGDRIALVDIREPYEWEIANLGEEGARLLPLSELGERSGELDPAEEIVVLCRSGSRSAKLVRELVRAGFPRVWNLRGGILAWSEEIDPTKRRY